MVEYTNLHFDIGIVNVGSDGSAIANPYHSAAPDATNIYVTAALNQAWYWATVG